jgi:hypothetical protein
MKHGVLKTWHPMVGRDFHIPWPPGSPAPAPSPVPYVTVAPMIGPTMAVATYANDFYSHYHGLTMLKVTDIGPFIPHFGPPSVLLAIEVPLSSSKSYFGSSRFQSGGQPIAVSLFFVPHLNLNCGTPMPTPTGVVFAITTHRVNMTWGDIFSGLWQMAVDWAITTALSWLGGKLGNAITSAIEAAVFNAVVALGVSDALVALMKAAPGIGTGVATVLGFLFGSPLGIDASTFGMLGQTTGDDGQPTNRGGPGDIAGNWYAKQGDDAGQALGNYLDGGLPNGYPVDFGTTGGDDYDEDLMDYAGKK